MTIEINGSGTITGVSVGGLPDGIVDTDMLAADAVSAAKLQSDAIAAGDLPAGSILQVKQKVITEVISYDGSSGNWSALTGFNLSITPASTSSKILVMVSVNFSSSNAAEHMGVRVKRGSTILGGHTNYGSRSIGFTAHQIAETNNNAEYSGGTFLDSPSTTSATTYTVEGYAGSAILYLNRVKTDTDHNHDVRGISTLTLMEVAA